MNIFSIIGYSYVIALVLFLAYCVYLFSSGASLIDQKKALMATIIASAMWLISLPLCGILFLLSMFNDNGPMWFGPAIFFSDLLFFLLCLYSLSNIWRAYRSGDYGALVRFISAPFAGVALVAIIILIISLH
jgi:hypothetical protein